VPNPTYRERSRDSLRTSDNLFVAHSRAKGTEGIFLAALGTGKERRSDEVTYRGRPGSRGWVSYFATGLRRSMQIVVDVVSLYSTRYEATAAVEFYPEVPVLGPEVLRQPVEEGRRRTLVLGRDRSKDGPHGHQWKVGSRREWI
jgi:hypothetical protein